MNEASPRQIGGASGHVARIDVLRAVAILLVFTSHFAAHDYFYKNVHNYWNGNWFTWSDQPGWLAQALRLTIFNGHLGVCLFFVISGLCIRLSHLGRGSFSFSDFIWRRFWRIYPPYLLALVVFTFLRTGAEPISPMNFISHLLLLHNFSLDYVDAINGPFWSLALEMQCYFLYPVLLYFCARWGLVWTGVALAVASAVSDLMGGERFIAYFHLPGEFALLRWMPTMLWFTWFIGFVIADRIHAGIKLNGKLLWLIVPLLPLFVLSNMDRSYFCLAEPVVGLLLALLTYAYLSVRMSMLELERAAALLGLCSYSFYLVFDQLIDPVSSAVASIFRPSSDLALAYWAYLPTFLAIFAVSWIAYIYLERPSIELGRRFIKGQLIKRPPPSS